MNSIISGEAGPIRTRWTGVAVKLVAVSLCLLFSTACKGGCNLFQGDAKNYFMVIDTSGSMGNQKDPLIEKVKTSVGDLLKNPVKEGDTVRLLTFDEQLTLHHTATIDGDSRQGVLDKVGEIAAQKKNTDMQGMILALRDMTAKIKEDDSREQVIVILSDGKDAPGPRRRKKKFSLSQLRKERPGFLQEDHIFYVSLTDAQSEKIVSNLKKDFPNTQVVGVKAVKKGKGGGTTGDSGNGKGTGTGKGSGTTGTGTGGTAGGGNRNATGGDMSDVVKTIRGNVQWNNILKYWWVLAIILVLLFLIWLIWLLMRKHRISNKPEGFILFYEDGVSHPTKTAYRLDRLETNKFSLGSRFGVNLRVKSLELPQDFLFTCRKKNNVSSLSPTGKSAALIKPIAQKTSGAYAFGDSFRIGNFIFEFSEERE